MLVVTKMLLRVTRVLPDTINLKQDKVVVYHASHRHTMIKKNRRYAKVVAKELTQTKPTKHCAKIALLAEAHQRAVQPVQTAPRDNFKTKPRKHRAKIVLSIHFPKHLDHLCVQYVQREEQRKKEVFDAKFVTKVKRKLVIIKKKDQIQKYTRVKVVLQDIGQIVIQKYVLSVPKVFIPAL